MIDNIIDSQLDQIENIFGNIYTLISNLFDFGLKEKEIKEIMEPKIKKYKLDNKQIKDIDDLIKMKLENENQEEENKKNEKYIEEINEIYVKEIQDEKEDKIDNNFCSKEEKNNKYRSPYESKSLPGFRMVSFRSRE